MLRYHDFFGDFSPIDKTEIKCKSGVGHEGDINLSNSWPSDSNTLNNC